MTQMKLFDRYVHQVGRRLPKRLRAGVKAELHSLLLDTLKERVGRPAGDETAFSEDEQAAVLQEFGPPAQMAARYQPRPLYLIGPKVFNLYFIVVAAVAGAGLLASIISTAVSAFNAAPGTVDALGLLVRGTTIFFSAAISGIGSTTLVFAVLERVIPEDRLKLDDEKEWDPHDLANSTERNQIRPASLIVQIAFLALLLIAFIVFPDRIGTGAYYDRGWHIIPFALSPAFFSLYLPLMEAQWVLTIVLNLILLRQGRWQLGTRIASLPLEGLDIYILVRLIAGPSILSANVLDQMRVIMPSIPIPPVTSTLKLAFLIALIVIVVETAIKVYRLVRSQSTATLSPIDAQTPA
jgi:hypothetical protein